MYHKHNLTIIEMTKYKARLTIHGGKQTYGINYFETYPPVVTWFAIRLLIIFTQMAIAASRFVMAYTQAPIKIDMYMERPPGIETKHGDSKSHVLKLLKSLMIKN